MTSLVFDPSPLTLWINCTFEIFTLAVLLPNFSTVLCHGQPVIMKKNYEAVLIFSIATVRHIGFSKIEKFNFL